MALTLLDYLFDRDTQAASNLSGMGKHGKKQLDPLMIYGIRCALCLGKVFCCTFEFNWCPMPESLWGHGVLFLRETLECGFCVAG